MCVSVCRCVYVCKYRRVQVKLCIRSETVGKCVCEREYVCVSLRVSVSV